MHWFGGVDGGTPIREIGWTWVLLGAGIVALGILAVRIYRDK